MSSHRNDNLRYYNNYQEVYRKPEGYFDPLAERVVKIFHTENSPLDSSTQQLRILDIGCGFGNLLESLQKVLGFRASYGGLTIAQHEFDHIQHHLSFITAKLGNQQDLVKLYSSSVFDVVINFCTLSYVVQKSQLEVLVTMNQLLVDKGLLVLGFIDDWVRKDERVKQSGKGYVQFYYHPGIFRVLERQAILVESFKVDTYRVHIWQKTNVPISYQGLRLYWWYIIRNRVLHLGLAIKVFKKINHALASKC